MTKRYISNNLASVHETALGLTEARVITKLTMSKFDEMCLTPVEEMTPEQLREITASRVRESGCVRALPKYENGFGEPMGTWKEEATGRFYEAIVACRKVRPTISRMIAHATSIPGCVDLLDSGHIGIRIDDGPLNAHLNLLTSNWYGHPDRHAI